MIGFTPSTPSTAQLSISSNLWFRPLSKVLGHKLHGASWRPKVRNNNIRGKHWAIVERVVWIPCIHLACHFISSSW